MKKLLVVLLSLGLIAAFSTTASALDFKLGGGFHVAGTYMDNGNLCDDAGACTTFDANLPASKFSRATFYTRTRLQPVLVIDDGLTFTMRFDALEKIWGNTSFKDGRSPQGFGGDDTTSSRRFYSSSSAAGTVRGGNAKLQENIEFERGFVTFKTQIGVFDIGYQQSGVWGTKGLQQDSTRPRIKFTSPFGPLTLLAIYEKTFEGGESPSVSNRPTGFVDADNENYNLAAIYNNGKGIEGGLLYQYRLNNANRVPGVAPTWPLLANSKYKVNLLAPYFQAAFGNFFIEGEIMYFFGKAAEQDVAAVGVPDVDLKAMGAFLHAKMAMGPAYVAAQFHYTSGDDFTDASKTTFYPGPTTTWTPALMLLDDDLADWAGGSKTTNGVNQGSGKQNATMYNVYAGYYINPKTNVEIDVTYALASKKGYVDTAGVVREAISDKMGTEVDLSLTYRLYDNLTYFVAAGYLWTGDYFKGVNAAATVGNNYIFMNRLILSF